MWFVPLAAITGAAALYAPLARITAATALASIARSLALVAVLAPLAGASLFTAVGYTAGLRWSLTLAGWLFVVSAAAAWYLGTALLLESQHGRAVLPTGRRRSPACRAPGSGVGGGGALPVGDVEQVAVLVDPRQHLLGAEPQRAGVGAVDDH